MLREKRLENGMTQMDLAIKLKVHPVTISDWERGVNFPQPRYRRALAEVFKCNPFDLFKDMFTYA